MKKPIISLLTFGILLLTACNKVESKPVTFVVDFSTAQQTNSGSSNFVEKMSKLFEDNGYNYLSKLEYDGYSQINENNLVTETGTTKVIALVIGSQSMDGSLTFTFKKKLESLSINANPRYSAYYSQGEYHFSCLDLRSAITVNKEEWVLRDSSQEIQNFDRVDRDFEINSNKLKVSANMLERVCINKMTLRFN